MRLPRLYWNGTKMIWDKPRTQGLESAPQLGQLGLHRKTTTVPGGWLWHYKNDETSYPKAREDSRSGNCASWLRIVNAIVYTFFIDNTHHNTLKKLCNHYAEIICFVFLQVFDKRILVIRAQIHTNNILTPESCVIGGKYVRQPSS